MSGVAVQVIRGCYHYYYSYDYYNNNYYYCYFYYHDDDYYYTTTPAATATTTTTSTTMINTLFLFVHFVVVVAGRELSITLNAQLMYILSILCRNQDGLWLHRGDACPLFGVA